MFVICCKFSEMPFWSRTYCNYIINGDIFIKYSRYDATRQYRLLYQDVYQNLDSKFKDKMTKVQGYKFLKHSELTENSLPSFHISVPVMKYLKIEIDVDNRGYY